jgi:hypothetical protein
MRCVLDTVVGFDRDEATGRILAAPQRQDGVFVGRDDTASRAFEAAFADDRMTIGVEVPVVDLPVDIVTAAVVELIEVAVGEIALRIFGDRGAGQLVEHAKRIELDVAGDEVGQVRLQHHGIEAAAARAARFWSCRQYANKARVLAKCACSGRSKTAKVWLFRSSLMPPSPI